MKKLYLVLFFLLISFLQNSPVMAVDKPSGFTPTQTKQIEQIIHSYIVNNPTVLVEASKKLRELEQAKEKEKLKKIEANIRKYKKRVFDDKAPGRIVLGNPNGKIIITEFTQHQCHLCKQSALIVEELAKNNPEIKLIVIYWPFFGKDAAHTAKATLAAQKQNKAKELNRALFAHKDGVTKEMTEDVIKSIKGLDNKKLSSDMKDSKHDKGLKNNFNLAQDLGLTGTPVFIFTNEKMTKFSLIPGKTINFEQDLNNALKDVGPPKPNG